VALGQRPPTLLFGQWHGCGKQSATRSVGCHNFRITQGRLQGYSRPMVGYDNEMREDTVREQSAVGRLRQLDFAHAEEQQSAAGRLNDQRGGSERSGRPFVSFNLPTARRRNPPAGRSSAQCWRIGRRRPSTAPLVRRGPIRAPRLLVIAVIGVPATAVVLRLVRFFHHQGDLGVAVGARCRCIFLVAMVNGVGIGFGRNAPSAARHRYRPMPRQSAIYRHLGLNWRPADCMALCRP
jgi:hypothetical protein